MYFDLSGAELFLAYLEGKTSEKDIFEHPAYQIVLKHAEKFSSALTDNDINNALQGKQSNFYGLNNVAKNTMRIKAFLETLRSNQNAWSDIVHEALLDFFPDENLKIPIYPIIGYDKGIGFNGAVCLNLNCVSYLNEPFEFLAYIIHECIHVIYERYHHIPNLDEVITPAQWKNYFSLWTQNEGYAVFVPYQFRLQHRLMDEPDYQVLSNSDQIKENKSAFLDVWNWLDKNEPHTQEEYLESCFGSQRLTYRVGCLIYQKIEEQGGRAATQEAFLMDWNKFLQQYMVLLK
ncbi:MAG: hypothetical protein CL609_05720 [Anaerolineaceae bacterium]|nr:hypothetical protein [Anaerolineaceae bacterium]